MKTAPAAPDPRRRLGHGDAADLEPPQRPQPVGPVDVQDEEPEAPADRGCDVRIRPLFPPCLKQGRIERPRAGGRAYRVLSGVQASPAARTPALFVEGMEREDGEPQPGVLERG